MSCSFTHIACYINLHPHVHLCRSSWRSPLMEYCSTVFVKRHYVSLSCQPLALCWDPDLLWHSWTTSTDFTSPARSALQLSHPTTKHSPWDILPRSHGVSHCGHGVWAQQTTYGSCRGKRKQWNGESYVVSCFCKISKPRFYTSKQKVTLLDLCWLDSCVDLHYHQINSQKLPSSFPPGLMKCIKVSTERLSI